MISESTSLKPTPHLFEESTDTMTSRFTSSRAAKHHGSRPDGDDGQPADQRFRPRGSRMGLLAFAIILPLTTIALPFVASASDIRSGTSVNIRQSERVTEDLYLSAGSVTIAGTVDRDASIAAGRASISGTVNGSVVLVSGRADISGTVRGSLRIASGTVEVGGDIGGDLLVLGGRVMIPSGGSIGGDLIVAGGVVELRGTVAGDVRGVAISTTVGGTVGGDVMVESSRFSVPASARITGDVRYSSAADPSISSAAAITGSTERVGQVPWQSSGDGAGRAFGPLLRTVWALIAGVVIIAIAPRLAEVIGQNGRAVLPAIGVGLLALIAVPIVTVFLIASTIGLPIGLIAIGLFIAILYLTQVFVGLAIGRFLLPTRWNDGSRGFHLLAMTIGVVILAALNFIPLPFASAVIAIVVTMWGLGAALMVLGQLASTPSPS